MNNKIIFTTYQRFPNSTAALELINLLDNNAVPFQIEDNTPDIASSFSGTSTENKFIVKIPAEHFDYVNRLQDEELEKEIENADNDHPLFQFTEEELMDVINKQDEWSRFDFVMAKKLLENKGRSINEALVEQKRIERLEVLSKPVESKKFWSNGGYFISIAGAAAGYSLLYTIPGAIGTIFAFGLAICGPCMGAIMITAKKALPDGKQVHMFSAKDRKHGKVILTIGLIAFLIFVGMIFYNNTKIFGGTFFG